MRVIVTVAEIERIKSTVPEELRIAWDAIWHGIQEANKIMPGVETTIEEIIPGKKWQLWHDGKMGDAIDWEFIQ